MFNQYSIVRCGFVRPHCGSIVCFTCSYGFVTFEQQEDAEKLMKREVTRTWANAQRDGRPAEYRWRPLFNAAVWLTPTTRVPCSNAAKTRNPLK